MRGYRRWLGRVVRILENHGAVLVRREKAENDRSWIKFGRTKSVAHGMMEWMILVSIGKGDNLVTKASDEK